MTGETIALAWELPHVPLYGDEGMEQYENETNSGALPLLHRIDESSIADDSIANSSSTTNSDYNNKWTHIPDSYYFGQPNPISNYFNQYNAPTSSWGATSDKINYYFNQDYRNRINQMNFNDDGNMSNDIDKYLVNRKTAWDRNDDIGLEATTR